MTESTVGKHVQIRVTTRDKDVFKEAAVYDDRSLSNWFVTLGNQRLKEIEREKERVALQRQREDGILPAASGVSLEVIPGIPVTPY